MKRKTLYFKFNPQNRRPLRVPMTEKEFLALKNLPDRWFISFGKYVLEVTKAEYDKYYKEYEHERYCKLNASGKVVHNLELDTFDPDYITVIDPFTRLAEPSVEDIVVEHLMEIFKTKRLHEAIDTLSPDDRQIIMMLFFMSKRQKDVAAELGITQQGVSKRLPGILRKLRDLLADLAE